MMVQDKISQGKRKQMKVIGSTHGLWIACILLAVAAAAWAQTNEAVRIRVEQPVAKPFEIEAAIPAPERIQPSEPISRPLSCRVICSPFEPRQSLAEISWPEQTGAAALDTTKLRLDIIGAASKFRDGNFGTVRIGAVPRVQTQPGADIDLEAVRKQAQPVFIQRVENNRITPRNPALPAPDELKKERLPRALPQLPQAAKSASTQDLQTGGFGRMQVIAQSVELRQAVPHRKLMMEGLQPGLTYKIRLVYEGAAQTGSVAENICRVPVCPADFVNQQ